MQDPRAMTSLDNGWNSMRLPQWEIASTSRDSGYLDLSQCRPCKVVALAESLEST